MTFHSERRDADLHLGCLPAKKHHPDFLSYAKDVRPILEKVGLLPKVPAVFGHGHSFAQGAWKMLGNGPDDTVFPGFGGAGDCAVAGPCHEEMEAASCAKRAIPNFTGASAIGEYSKLTKEANGEAYDPDTGQGDTGLNPQQVFKHRQTVGLRDADGKSYVIGQVIELDPGNLQHLWEGAFIFENAGIGLVLTEAQQGQFDAGPQPVWDYVAGSPEIGGHYVPVMGKVGLISWAEDVYYSPKFIEEQMTQGYCFIDRERYNAVTGKTAEHWKDQDLERFLTELAAQTATPEPPAVTTAMEPPAGTSPGEPTQQPRTPPFAIC